MGCDWSRRYGVIKRVLPSGPSQACSVSTCSYSIQTFCPAYHINSCMLPMTVENHVELF